MHSLADEFHRRLFRGSVATTAAELGSLYHGQSGHPTNPDGVVIFWNHVAGKLSGEEALAHATSERLACFVAGVNQKNWTPERFVRGAVQKRGLIIQKSNLDGFPSGRPIASCAAFKPCSTAPRDEGAWESVAAADWDWPPVPAEPRLN